jgi:UDP-N-acetyl-D-glucosamine dehydrogenase
MFARELGLDMWEVVSAASTKPFGFMPFYPGPGVGGHCLPIDPTYFSWHVQQSTGQRLRFVELANDINEQMPDYVVQRLAKGLNRLGKPILGSRVLLLGLAYKKNSSDARESPSTTIARLLASEGAHVSAADDQVSPGHLAELSDDLDLDLVQCEARRILDCRNRLTGPNVESLEDNAESPGRLATSAQRRSRSGRQRATLPGGCPASNVRDLSALPSRTRTTLLRGRRRNTRRNLRPN